MQMKTSEIEAVERAAEANGGHCPTCSQTIKIYRYAANKPMVVFMRAMADEVRNTNANDVNIATIGLSYSVRTQVTKIRLHGLIARIKDEHGKQLPSRWLITHKGWDFVNGKSIPKRVIVFNNQVLGHDGDTTTIHTILGERYSPQPEYEETPISPAEARTYEDVRMPTRLMVLTATYKGRPDRYQDKVEAGQFYELKIERLVVGKPVKIISPLEIEYRDIAAFQREWRIE